MLISQAQRYQSIAIIGMSKNAGKTTVLNYLLAHMDGQIGITSVGLDGEEFDTISKLKKPKITVHVGMLIATAASCIQKSSSIIDVLETTSIQTPLGKIIIGRVTKEGTILLAGPSSNTQLKKMKRKLFSYGASRVIIDGALFRKSIAAYDVVDGIIVATGASYHRNMNVVIKDTSILINTLKKELYSGPYHDLLRKEKTSCLIQDGNLIQMRNNNTFKQVDACIQTINDKTNIMYLAGALTNRVIELLIKKRNLINNLTIIVRDASCILADYSLVEQLDKIPIAIQVLHPVDVIAVTINPVAPGLYRFNESQFFTAIQNEIPIHIFNVKQKRSENYE